MKELRLRWNWSTLPAISVARMSYEESGARARYLWAMLIARLFESLPRVCPNCGADMRIVAFITEAAPVERILDHLGESAEPPRIAPAGGPPAWDDLLAPFPDWDTPAQPAPESSSISASPGKRYTARRVCGERSRSRRTGAYRSRSPSPARPPLVRAAPDQPPARLPQPSSLALRPHQARIGAISGLRWLKFLSVIRCSMPPRTDVGAVDQALTTGGTGFAGGRIGNAVCSVFTTAGGRAQGRVPPASGRSE
jgi:hypothetical protein